jgi:F-type H+-transporting ATPase subunit epsilon
MLKLTLVTPLKKMTVDLPVEEIFVPGFRGELNILEGHSPLVTTLSTGVLRYREAGSHEQKLAAVSWGYLEVYNNSVTILAETAEFPEEIDIARAEEALKKAEQALVAEEASPFTFEKYHSKLDRAQARLSLAKGTQSKEPTPH